MLKKIIFPITGELQRRWVGNDISNCMTPSVSMVLREILSELPSPSAVVIGANDGIRSDSLYPYLSSGKISALLIEPHPDAFQKLTQNYENYENIRLCNKAISHKPGVSKFYVLKEDYAQYLKGLDTNPHFDSRISSFSKEHILKHTKHRGDWREIMYEIQVPSCSFSEICDEHSMHKIDILQIDAEGFDYEILSTVDLSKLDIKIVIFEHIHLGHNFENALKHLKHHSFVWAMNSLNLYAIPKKTHSRWIS